jgi:hypothetical protein
MPDNTITTSETSTPPATKDPNLHEIAGGWILERKGTDVPPFLKATYIIVAGSGITYSIIWANGDAGDSERGHLVQQFNAATGFSASFMWFVTALVVVFALILFKFAFTKHKD